jgi:ribosomal-protein-alanine N-acetyltransferase
MQSAASLEPARLSDARAIAEMSRRLIEAGMRWRHTPAAIAERIQNSDTEVVVARRDGRVVGFAILEFRFAERAGHLILMAVDPELRRCGVGRSLVRWLEPMARLGGLATVHLEVRASNSEAQAFYRSLGFRRACRLPAYYEGREDAFSMVRDLARALVPRPN